MLPLAFAALLAVSPVFAQADMPDPAAVAATPLQMMLVPAGLTGSGVRVGVIDSGIAVSPGSSRHPTNPCFTDVSYAPASQVGDPAYTNNKVVVARAYGTHGGRYDAEGLGMHGSHVAGIIACNDGTVASLAGVDYPLRGVAPGVVLGSYNVFPGVDSRDNAPEDEELSAAVGDAVADGMGVLNLSLGGDRLSSPRTSRAVSAAWRAGVVVVAAAGNDGPKSKTVASPANNPDVIAVGALDSGWSAVAAATVGSSVVTGDVGPGVSVSSAVSAPLAVAEFTQADARATAQAPKSARMPNPLRIGLGCVPESYSSAGSVFLVARGACTFDQKISAAAAAGVTGLIVVSFDDSPVLPSASASSRIPAMVVGLSAGKVLAPLAPGMVLLEPAAVRATGHVGELAWFSSKGPDASGLSKPDVLAPGAGVLSAAAGESCSPGGYCFAMESGTSMAAPMVTGVVALVKSAHPDWSAPMVRSAVVHTARLVPGVSVNAQGAGIVDASAAVSARLGLSALGVGVRSGSAVRFQVLNPGDTPVRVSLKVSKAPGRPLRGIYKVTPSVMVPAHGSAPVSLQVFGSSTGADALLTASLDDGYSVHAVVSTLRF